MALVGEVADLVRAVREFLSYVIGTPSKTLAWKRKVFTEFVEPANEQLEAIHEDYLRLFAEALRMLEKEGASSEVVDWIYERRSHLAFERRSLAGLQVPDAQFNDREWIDAAHGFVAGVHHYFGHFDTPLTDPEPSKTPRTAGRLFAGEVHEATRSPEDSKDRLRQQAMAVMAALDDTLTFVQGHYQRLRVAAFR